MAFRGTDSELGTPTTVKEESGESWSDDLHELPDVEGSRAAELKAGSPPWWTAEPGETVAPAPEPEATEKPRLVTLIGWMALAVMAIPVALGGGIPRLLVYLGIIAVATALYSLITRRPTWAAFASKRVAVVALGIGLVLTTLGGALVAQEQPAQTPSERPSTSRPIKTDDPVSTGEATAAPIERVSALDVLMTLEVKGRAPKTGYDRELQFGAGWQTGGSGCSLREEILIRDLTNTTMSDVCETQTGTLLDPFTGKAIAFTRGWDTSAAVQIDHVVALSNAWQTGAQQLSFGQRLAFANDPLNLIAVDGPANQQKSDGDAATWLPSNKSFRCEYVARQISVKAKYELWITPPEHEAMVRILSVCPNQPATVG